MAILRKVADRIRNKLVPTKIAAEPPPSTALTKVADGKGSNGPSPNPMTNLILADIALRGGGALLRRAVEGSLLGKVTGTAKAKKIIKGRSMTQTLVGTALARVATRSVPGAIVIGGGLLAKTLYERKRANQARKDGEKVLDELASKD